MTVCRIHIYDHQISFDGITYTTLELGGYVKFTWSREKDQIFFRCKSNEWKVIRGWNMAQYDELKLAIDNPDSVTTEIKVRTWLNDADGTPIEVYYEGLVNLQNCKVDADGEAIMFTPDTDDDYSWYDNAKGIKYNYQSILGYDEIVTYEKTAGKVRIFQDTSVTPPGVSGFSEACSETPDAWLTGRHYIVTDYDYDNGDALGSETTRGWCTYVGHFFKCKLEHIASSVPTIGGDAYWDEMSPPPQDYVRYESDLPFDDFLTGDGVYDDGYPNVTTVLAGATNCALGRFYSPVCSSGTEVKTVVTRARLFMSFVDEYGVINKMLEENGKSTTIVSTFFSDATNPVTGTANKLLNLILTTKEAIINGVNSSNVNPGLSFEDAFTILRALNCRWYMDGNTLHIEHIKYFENGYSYAGTPAVGVYLTSATYPYRINNTKSVDGGNNLNIYSFDGDFPSREVFKWAEQLGNDGYIEYLSLIAAQGKEVVHNFQILTTDLEIVLKFPDQVDEDGWALIACDATNKIWQRDTRKLGYYPGSTTGTMYEDVINGDLYWDHILAEFWTYGRPLSNSKINGDAVTMDSTRRSKKQEKVRFQRMKQIDTIELIETFMGEAEIDQMEIDTETDYILCSLLYEIT